MMHKWNIRYRFYLLFVFSICSTISYPCSVCAEEKPKIFTVGNPDSVETVCFSPDGRYAVSAGENQIKFWDLTTGSLVRTFGERKFAGSETRKVVFSPDGRYILAVGTWSSHLWDVSTGRKVKILKGAGISCAYSPDGRYVIMGKNDNTATLWSLTKGRKVRTFNGHLGSIEAVAFSPDAKYIITGSRDYTLKLWDVTTGSEIRIFEGHSNWVKAVVFSPDGRYILSRAMNEYYFRLWDVETGDQIRTLKSRGDVKSITFSPNGKYILYGGQDGGYDCLRVLNFDTGDEIKSIKIDSLTLNPITFSSDGRYALCGVDHNKIKLWDIENAKEVATMISFENEEWVIITPEGYFNASQGGVKYMKVRVEPNTYSINNFFERFYNPGLIVKRLSGRKVVLAHDIRKGVAIPPQVRIVNPKKGETFNEGKIDIVVKVVNRGGGIDEVRLYQNGCAIGDKKRGLTIKTIENELEKTFNVTLVQGENRFKAVGFSRDRTEGGFHEITVNYAGGKNKIDLYLVVIGINDYKNPSLKLNFAVADAKGLKDFFEKKWKNLFNNLHLIEIYDRDATKKNIRRLLSGMGSKEQDVVLVFLAGHGLNIKDEWFFLPYDVVFPEKEEHVKERGISSIEMKEMIVNNRSLKKALFVDACKSGGMLLALSRGVEDRRAIAQLARSTGTHIVAASTGKQFASEVSQLGHGVFTYALLQGLNGEASDRDETVTVRELIAYIEQKLPGISEKYRQKPQYPVVDSRGQDFPLVVNR